VLPQLWQGEEGLDVLAFRQAALREGLLQAVLSLDVQAEDLRQKQLQAQTVRPMRQTRGSERRAIGRIQLAGA